MCITCLSSRPSCWNVKLRGAYALAVGLWPILRSKGRHRGLKAFFSFATAERVDDKCQSISRRPHHAHPTRALLAHHAGYITLSATDPIPYTFVLESDDGSMLWIDGKVVISNPGEPLSMC